MKKKLLLALLVITIMIMSGVVTASAERQGVLYYTISSGEAIITDCMTSANGDIVIPDTIGGYPVTSISSYAFQQCYYITSIKIPKSVTFIGQYAFAECKSLRSVEIPEGVKSIKYATFSYCRNLTSIEIPNSVTIIDEFAFCHCETISSVIIPPNVTRIENSAFSDCYNLTSITIQDSVESIGIYAFASCDKLKDVYYNGTAENWNAISIGASNDALNNVTKHYFAYVTLLNNSGNIISSITQNMGELIDTSAVVIPEGYELVLYKDKKHTERYDVDTPITENITLYVDFMQLNILEFEGTTTADIGEKGFVQKISFATDKNAQYFSCTLKVPNSLAVQEIKSDIFDIEQDHEIIGNDTQYYLFLIYNCDGNIPTYKTLNAFEIVLDVSENAVADEVLAIEILNGAFLANDDGNSYEFTSIGKAEIKINPILAEKITIVGADEIDVSTQYTVSVLPENTTNSNVEWSVSSEMIATISEDGVLTPVKKGTVTIRATAKDGSGIYDEKEVSVKVLGMVNSIVTNIGIWDKEYSPNTTNYTIYVPKTTTSIRLTAKHDGAFKGDGLTLPGNVARTVTLSTTSNETVLELTYTCDGYDDNKYTITIIKFEGTKTEVSEDKKSFCITPINIENGKTVILALYDGEKFVEMQSAVYTGEEIPFTTTKTYTKAKVMVWDVITNLKPVCGVEEIN